MSRLTTMSPEAIKQLFSPDADSTLVCLMTVYDTDGVTAVARIADNYLTRISETDDDVIYGVVSRGDSFNFLPLRITPPSEDSDSPTRCTVTLQDVTRHITPIIRSITSPPKVKLEWVLSKTPELVEVAHDDLFITNFQYDAQQVTAELSAIDMDREPIPAYSFTPQFNPGLF